MRTPFVSIVIPVRNAESILGECLLSLQELDYPRDSYEVIIADSLSTDRTREIARQFGARVATTPKRSVCAGRNAGFNISRGDLVAFSDADCVMYKDWLKNAIKYFADEKVAAVGGPNLVPDDDSCFSQAVDVQFAYSYYITQAAPVRVLARVIESRSHGSNIIFRKDILDKVMPMSEELIEGEDVEMNNRIADMGYKLLYVPDVIVWHKRRATPRSWFKQMYGYGIGRFIVGHRDRAAFNYMHILIGGIIPLFFLVLLAALFLWPILLKILFGFFVLITAALFLLALWDKKSLRVALWFPVVAYCSVGGWSAGFLRAMLLRKIIPFRRMK